MTLEQAIKKIQDKESQITQLQLEVADTKRQLIKLTPFKYGQKVTVHNSNGKTVCFISGAEYKSWIKGKIEYTFNKMKKDGTMSEQSAGVYSYDRIDALNN